MRVKGNNGHHQPCLSSKDRVYTELEEKEREKEQEVEEKEV